MDLIQGLREGRAKTGGLGSGEGEKGFGKINIKRRTRFRTMASVFAVSFDVTSLGLNMRLTKL